MLHTEGNFFLGEFKTLDKLFFSSFPDHLRLAGKLLAPYKVFDIQYDKIGKM